MSIFILKLFLVPQTQATFWFLHVFKTLTTQGNQQNEASFQILGLPFGKFVSLFSNVSQIKTTRKQMALWYHVFACRWQQLPVVEVLHVHVVVRLCFSLTPQQQAFFRSHFYTSNMQCQQSETLI